MLVDRIVEVLVEKYNLGEGVRIVSTGSSMGGLMALYGAVAFNKWFSKAACVSSSIGVCMEEIKKAWADFSGVPQELNLPSAPKQFLHYFTEDNMPQTKLARDLEKGMAVSIGRLREDSQYDYKFVCVSHNTLRGAAGGAVLLAELLCAKGYMD